MDFGGRANAICSLSRYSLRASESRSSFWEFGLPRGYIASLLINSDWVIPSSMQDPIFAFPQPPFIFSHSLSSYGSGFPNMVFHKVASTPSGNMLEL